MGIAQNGRQSTEIEESKDRKDACNSTRQRVGNELSLRELEKSRHVTVKRTSKEVRYTYGLLDHAMSSTFRAGDPVTFAFNVST